jgi:hypothetical protein
LYVAACDDDDDDDDDKDVIMVGDRCDFFVVRFLNKGVLEFYCKRLNDVFSPPFWFYGRFRVSLLNRNARLK